MTAVILLIVLWQAGTKLDVSAYMTAGNEVCGTMAQSFIQAEEVSNARSPPAFQDYYTVTCELMDGEPAIDS